MILPRIEHASEPAWDGSWITFWPQPLLRKPGMKTDIWMVKGQNGGPVLGYIKWFGRWRKYSFFPKEETVFEPTCLDEIAEFIRARMAERKK